MRIPDKPLAELTGYLSIGPGRHPSGQGPANFFVNFDELRMLERDGPAWKFDNAVQIGKVLDEPASGFEGLNRPEFDAGYCYSMRLFDFYQGNEVHPAEPGSVFVVFLKPGKGTAEFVVIDWAIREEDAMRQGYPKGWREAFSRELWSKT